MHEAVIELKNPETGQEEHKSVSLDFSADDRIAAGQTVTAASLSQPSPPDANLTVSTPLIIASGRVVLFSVTGGTAGQLYPVLCKATLSGGDVVPRSILVRVISL